MMSEYAPHGKPLHLSLKTGKLDFTVTRSAFAPEELTGFAARNNPRRGFLFVSKVLGKHWPVKPSVMRRIHVHLATELAACSMAGPIFTVGMAETATALGRGVFEEFCALTGMKGVYCHTTRYRLRHGGVCFSEDHCHASEHWLHLPQSPAEATLLHNTKTLVLVDDEMSTGTTFCNLVRALKDVLPLLERVVVVTLLDMTGRAALQRLRETCSCPVQGVSLLEGNFDFQPRPDMCWETTVTSVGDGQYKDHLLPSTGGRVGVVPKQYSSLCLPMPLLEEGAVLVLGTGEFMYEPYRFALNLEQEGREVYFQATTRSPILQGHDIHSILAFKDNYGEHIDNYLYNVESENYGTIVLCYETPSLPADHTLPFMLDARCIHILN